MPVQQADVDSHWVWPLVEKGLTVFPLGTAGERPPHWVVDRAGGTEKAAQLWPKTPRAAWKEWQTHRPNDTQITQWIVQHPGCNFAIATGKEVDVVDADDQDAIDFVLANLTRTPWVVRTGKGAHFYYQTNERLTIKNTADPSAKLDTRGYGGYVVAPGSTHGSGRRYELEIDPAWPVDTIKDLPSLSPDDLAKIAGYKGAGHIQTTFGGPAGNLAGFTAAPIAQSAGVQEGGRNNNLARLVGGWIKQGYSVDQVLSRAMQTNAGNQPPLPDAEVMAVIASVTRTHVQNHADDAQSTVVTEAPDPKKLLLRPTEMQVSAPSWLIKGVVPSSGIGLLYGPSGSGKSFAVLDMALNIAAGRDWHGRKLKRQGGVIYVCGEGQQGVANRLRAWEKHTGITLDGLPLRVTRAPVRLLDPASVAALIEAIKAEADALGLVVAIVIDTLNRNFGDGDENTTKDMTRFLDAATDLQKDFDTTVLVVHHTGHQEGDRARGSSALRAAMDFEIQHKPTDENTQQFTLIGRKMKDGSEMPASHFYLKTIALGIDEDGDEYGSCVIEMMAGDALEGAEIAAGLMKKLGPNEQKMLKILTDRIHQARANRPQLVEVVIERQRLVDALKGAGIMANKTATQIAIAEQKKWLRSESHGSVFVVSKELIDSDLTHGKKAL